MLGEDELSEGNRQRLAIMVALFERWWLESTGGPGLGGAVRRSAMESVAPVIKQSFIAGFLARDDEVAALEQQIKDLEEDLRVKADAFDEIQDIADRALYPSSVDDDDADRQMVATVTADTLAAAED